MKKNQANGDVPPKARFKKSTKLPPEKKDALPKKNEIVYLSPPDLPLTDEWYTVADLMKMFKVERGAVSRYRKSGILRPHKWGGTLRFNKTYVDWMIHNGGNKLLSIICLMAIPDIDWLMDMAWMSI